MEASAQKKALLEYEARRYRDSTRAFPARLLQTVVFFWQKKSHARAEGNGLGPRA
jgi:hypothetical protein